MKYEMEENRITDIRKLLDWNNPEELQERGRFYAEQLDDIQVLIQPVKKEYNKNVWDNCEAVLEKKNG